LTNSSIKICEYCLQISYKSFNSVSLSQVYYQLNHTYVWSETYWKSHKKFIPTRYHFVLDLIILSFLFLTTFYYRLHSECDVSLNSIDYNPNLTKRKEKTKEVKRKLHHGVIGKYYVFKYRYIQLNLIRLHTTFCLVCLLVNNIAKYLCILWFNKDGPQTKNIYLHANFAFTCNRWRLFQQSKTSRSWPQWFTRVFFVSTLNVITENLHRSHHETMVVCTVCDQICRKSKTTLLTVDDLLSSFSLFSWNLLIKPTMLQFYIPSFAVSIVYLNIFARMLCVSRICFDQQDNYTETIAYNQLFCAVFPK
jgi:hypothetical protein